MVVMDVRPGIDRRKDEGLQMSTVIVIAVLALIVFFAAKSSMKHLKGEGDCCGGGGGEIFAEEPEKKLDGPVVATKTVHIEGMHCEKCKARVERAINRLEGASAKVDLKKNVAVVSMDRPVPDELIRNAVTMQDYKVISIEG